MAASNETMFAKVASRMGQFSVTIKLQRHSDDSHVVVVSIYSPKNVKRKAELWGELTEVAITFQGTPMQMGGDFNVTLEEIDRLNNARGQDPDSEDFKSFITEAHYKKWGW